MITPKNAVMNAKDKLFGISKVLDKEVGATPRMKTSRLKNVLVRKVLVKIGDQQ